MIYNLSARLKQLRQEKHLKQEQVALLVGVTKSVVSSWELDMLSFSKKSTSSNA